MRLAKALGLAAAATLLVPGSSLAAVTFGSNLTAGGTPTNACASGQACTFAQVAPLPAANTASGGLTAPMDGVIVRWRVKAGSAGAAVNLRVLRPTGAGAFTAAGTSATQSTTGGTDTFDAQLVVRQGDYLGLNNASSALLFAPTPGASIYRWTPQLADGTNRAATDTQGARELLVQAEAEPDRDCDGLGDETQDVNTGDGPCIVGDGDPGTPGDRTAPVLDRASVRPRTWAVSRRGRAEIRLAATRRAPRGTSFRYRLSEPAQVIFRLERRLIGRRVGGRCVRRTRANASRRRCVLYRAAGSFGQKGRAGANRKRFSGRIGRRRLRPGRYRATLLAVDPAFNTSRPVRLRFRVVRR